jgi:hypothetical protein
MKRAVTEMNARIQTMLRIQQQYLLTGTTPSALGAMSILREERRRLTA